MVPAAAGGAGGLADVAAADDERLLDDANAATGGAGGLGAAAAEDERVLDEIVELARSRQLINLFCVNKLFFFD